MQLHEIDELKKLNFNIFYIKISFFESILNIFTSFFSRIPFQVAWYKSERMKLKVSQLINSGKYDVAYFHLIRSAQYFPEYSAKNSVLNVIDFTDAVSLYLKRFFSIEKNLFKKIFLGIEKKRIEEYKPLQINLMWCSFVLMSTVNI